MRLLNRALIICLCVAASLSSVVCCTSGAPYELLANGNFVNGLRGWTSEGLVYLEQGYVRIDRYGSISQTVERQDLSLFLELSYDICTVFRVVASPASYARSVVTYYVTDQQGRAEEFAIVGKRHEEFSRGFPEFQTVRIDLSGLFYSRVGRNQTYSVKKVKLALELGFYIFAPYVASVYFRNVSLKRCNPVKLAVQQDHVEFVNRTEFSATIANLGDLDAFNLVVRLDLPADLFVVSEPMIFQRSSLEGGSSWRVSWMIYARSSGSHPITVRVKADQAEAQSSTSVPFRAPQPVTQTTIQTVTNVQTVTTRVIALSVELLVLTVVVAGIIVATVVYAYSSQRKRRL